MPFQRLPRSRVDLSKCRYYRDHAPRGCSSLRSVPTRLGHHSARDATTTCWGSGVFLTASVRFLHTLKRMSSLISRSPETSPEKEGLIADYLVAVYDVYVSAIREDGRIRTAMKPGRIYPVCISDEPAVESFFFTSYANETFEKESPAGSRIRPVTMMSVNELEEILPYLSENLFSWPELLDFRLGGPTRGAFSVHQAIYDLLREKGFSARRNQAIRKSFDEVWKIIGSRYKPPKAR